MKTINIHEAKTQRSRLVEEAADGKPFIIAKAGKPLVKVTALGTPKAIGFVGAASSGIPSPYRTTLTPWAAPKSHACFRARNEALARYPLQPLPRSADQKTQVRARGTNEAQLKEFLKSIERVRLCPDFRTFFDNQPILPKSLVPSHR